MVNVYNGVLISYVTATHEAPQLINSADDLTTKPEIHLVVNRGQGTDFVLSVCVLFFLFFLFFLKFELINSF